MMDEHEKEQFAHALGQTLKFFKQDLDEEQFSIWRYALRDYSLDQIKSGLLRHTKEGKFAPKPRDIIDHISRVSSFRAHQALPPPVQTDCPKEIARAWMWFNCAIARGSESLDGLFSRSGNATEEEQEKYLLIVNQEARRMDNPDAIPDEYKIEEIWG